MKLHGFLIGQTETLLLQTLIGAWPIDAERLHTYMEKATREAKQQTSWTENNPIFEEALKQTIDAALGCKEFVDELETFVARIDEAGRTNSLTQVLLKNTVPGVPDTYQGSEIWDRSLVDPDNRRPVDYALRARLLQELRDLAVTLATRRRTRCWSVPLRRCS